MSLYRTLRSLTGKGGRIPANEILILDWDEARLNKLLELRIIAHVSPPPLSELPGWAARARRLARNCSIQDAEQFLEADNQILRKCLGKREGAEVENLKQEVLKWLQPAKRRKDCGC
jgi:hypothetical protein